VAVIEYASRTNTLPAPPPIVWEDLIAPRETGTRAWLELVDDEVPPRIIEAVKPSRVLWSSLWPGRPDDQVLLRLTPTGVETTLQFTLKALDEAPDQAAALHLRHRLSTLLFAELRYSYGQ
jgi:hypothetical protein